MKLLYQFSAGDSFLHRLDPRTKLVFVVCFLISTFLLPHPWVMPLVIIAIIWILGPSARWSTSCSSSSCSR